MKMLVNVMSLSITNVDSAQTKNRYSEKLLEVIIDNKFRRTYKNYLQKSKIKT